MSWRVVEAEEGLDVVVEPKISRKGLNIESQISWARVRADSLILSLVRSDLSPICRLPQQA
jgi:hypothetical protein